MCIILYLYKVVHEGGLVLYNDVYIDFEMNKDAKANSLNEIIAVGAIKVRNGEIIGQFKENIAMMKSDFLNERVTVLTGICMKDLESAESFNEVLTNLLQWVDVSKVGHFYLFGDYDYKCLRYTYDLNRHYKKPSKEINEFVRKTYFRDLKKELSLIDENVNFTALPDLVVKYAPSSVIDNRKLHDPLYDSYLLFKLHQSMQKRSN